MMSRFAESTMKTVLDESAIVEQIFHALRTLEESRGQRDLPSVPGLGHFGPNARCLAINLPSLETAKLSVDVCELKHMLTWAHVVTERLCEVVCAQDDKTRREQLFKLAAEVVGWIENLQRRAELIRVLEAKT